jgi:hypothetical protein
MENHGGLNMKKMVCAALFLSIAPFAFSQVTLDEAIKSNAAKVSSMLKNGSLIVQSADTASCAMADYVVDKLIVAFLEEGKLSVMGGAALDQARQELSFSDSGEVSDSDMSALNGKLRAQFIVSCSLKKRNDLYYFHLQVMAMETAMIKYISDTNVW